RVAAATTVGDKGFARTEALIAAGVDLVVVDTAHGHSQRVLAAVNRIKRLSNAVQVVAGNIVTAEGAKALIDAGADAIKVGIGPGSICTTRIVAGVGMPQLTAIMDAVAVARALHQLAGGLRAAMGYVGAKTLAEFRQKARFVRISSAGLRESHVHDVTITRESPNYPSRG